MQEVYEIRTRHVHALSEWKTKCGLYGSTVVGWDITHRRIWLNLRPMEASVEAVIIRNRGVYYGTT